MKSRSGFIGATHAQRTLVRYWNGLATCGIVRRSSIDPGAVRSFLSNLSILDVSNPSDPVFRLAGSRLIEIVGEQPRGRKLNSLAGPIVEAWSLGLDAVQEKAVPVGGVMSHGEALHAWVRLPLSGADGSISQVLCHDELLTIAQFAECAAVDRSIVPKIATAKVA